jgi:DNA-binding response OmpR family regulator
MAMAPARDLQDLRVLVVEDTLLIADVIVDELQDQGCKVVGPVPRVAPGLALATTEQLDGAFLDVNLAGEQCFPIADALAARSIPFVLLTGYGESAVPPAYRGAPRLSKPFRLGELIDAAERYFRKRD